MASDIFQAVLDKVSEEFGVATSTNNADVVNFADIVFLAVKPQYLPGAIEGIKDLDFTGKVVVSIAAGQSLEKLTGLFGKELKLIRVMPNTPALVGEGMSALSPNSLVTDDECETVLKLFESFGEAEIVPEKLQDAVVGISGSSPAYVYMFIEALIKRAITDQEKGLGSYEAVIDDDALDFLADIANGDARAALTAIELGVLTTDRAEDGKIHITIDVASECIQRRVIKYDKDGDNHYDTISAFIKSMRGSDPDAAVYYLARMLYAGEDPKFIARRICICASEDVGNADPQALVVATSAFLAVERIGMPESRIILSHAATYVACAPKSNSAYGAIDLAMAEVKNNTTRQIPKQK